MTPTATYRNRLAQARERKQDAMSRRKKARDMRETARAAGDAYALRLAESTLGNAELDYQVAQELENTLLSQMTGVGSAGISGTGSFLEDPETIRQLEALATSSLPIGNLMLGPIMDREALIEHFQQQSMAAAGDVTIPDSARLGPYYGLVPQLRRRLRLLDLIPAAPMEGKSFDYTQESGSLDTAAETAEGAMKPGGSLTLTDAQVVAKTIATWYKTPRQQLADVPALAQALQSRLVYGVQRRVENQIVGGDGTGENLLGILNTTGIGSVAFSAGAPLTDLTLDAITAVALSDAEPNAVVVNPLDVAAMLKNRATGSGERLDSDGAFATPPTTIWGLPAIQSKVIPAGQALVGDFANGATLFVREGVNVRVSDSDGSDFIQNRVTMLGEGRFGLAVWQPAAFSVVHFA